VTKAERPSPPELAENSEVTARRANLADDHLKRVSLATRVKLRVGSHRAALCDAVAVSDVVFVRCVLP